MTFPIYICIVESEFGGGDSESFCAFEQLACSTAGDEANMAQGLNIDRLIEEAVQVVPKELQEDLRDWLCRAHKGKNSELSQEMLGKAQELWRAFDSSAKEVETKLQQ